VLLLLFLWGLGLTILFERPGVTGKSKPQWNTNSCKMRCKQYVAAVQHLCYITSAGWQPAACHCTAELYCSAAGGSSTCTASCIVSLCHLQQHAVAAHLLIQEQSILLCIDLGSIRCSAQAGRGVREGAPDLRKRSLADRQFPRTTKDNGQYML
jgi:hypothetical protein